MNTIRRHSRTSTLVLMACVFVLLGAGQNMATAEPQERFAGYSDIGPTAWESISGLHESIVQYTKAAETLWNKKDAKLSTLATTWYNTTTDFYDAWDKELAKAEAAAKKYMGGKWTGQWPDDWKKWIDANRKFVRDFDSHFSRALMFYVNMQLDMKDMAEQKANNDLRLAQLSLAIERVSNMNDDVAEFVGNAELTPKRAGAWVDSFEKELPLVTNAVAMLQEMAKDSADFLKKLSERKDYRQSALFTELNEIFNSTQDNPLVSADYSDVIVRMTESADKNFTAYKKQFDDYKKTYDPLINGTLFDKFIVFKGHAYSEIPGIVQSIIKNLKDIAKEG